MYFYHALLAERATASYCVLPCNFSISIHALLAESDKSGNVLEVYVIHFYPRSPCGERHTVSTPNRPKE